MFKRLVLALALGLAGAGKTRPGDTQAASQMCCRHCGQNSFTSCSLCVPLQKALGQEIARGAGPVITRPTARTLYQAESATALRVNPTVPATENVEIHYMTLSTVQDAGLKPVPRAWSLLVPTPSPPSSRFAS